MLPQEQKSKCFQNSPLQMSNGKRKEMEILEL
jgi:hypothetical protein